VRTAGRPAPESAAASEETDVLQHASQGGDVVERISRRGKFYGCANYPKCDFVSNYEPVEQKCDECGGDMIKKDLKKGTFIECTKCKKKTLISEN